MPKFLTALLLPFSALYGLAIRFRHGMYRNGFFSRTTFDFPIICVGNLAVGGTGKTPHIEWLIAKLLPHYLPAVLSRGYKRNTIGYLKASATTTVKEIGDEPFQIFKKFNPDVEVAVCENRVLGIPQLIGDCPNTDLILMDDGYQHLAVKAGFNILLTDFKRPYFNDYLLPAGLLREPITEAKNANYIVVTKCPTDLSLKTKQDYISKLNPEKNQKVFFSKLAYGQLLTVTKAAETIALETLQHVFILSGIAKAGYFHQKVESQFIKCDKMVLPDHVAYTDDVVQQLAERFKNSGAAAIITTEKDAVKLADGKILPHLQHIPIWYLPIQIELLFNDEKEFLDGIFTYIHQTKNNT